MQRFRALAILALLLAASPALAQRAACHRGASFEQWLDAFKREAVTQGVSQRAIGASADQGFVHVVGSVTVNSYLSVFASASVKRSTRCMPVVDPLQFLSGRKLVVSTTSVLPSK